MQRFMAMEKKQYFLVVIYGCSNVGIDCATSEVSELCTSRSPQHTSIYNPATECSLHIEYLIPHQTTINANVRRAQYLVIMENWRGDLSFTGHFDPVRTYRDLSGVSTRLMLRQARLDESANYADKYIVRYIFLPAPGTGTSHEPALAIVN